MRDENNSLSYHRIHLNWLTNKNTLLHITVIKWSTTTVKSFKQVGSLFRSDTLQPRQLVPLYEIKMFPATLGFTCKQLKHTFCKDDFIIPGLRLHNEEFLFHRGRSHHMLCIHTCVHTCAHTYTHIQSHSPKTLVSLRANYSGTCLE